MLNRKPLTLASQISFMKSFKRLFTFGLLIVAFSSFTGIKDEINAAFKAGNAFKVAAHFDSKIDITILDEGDLLTKLEAEKMLYDFFYSHHPTDFKVLHHGESKSGSEYTIGQLITDNGNFRVSYYINKSNNSEQIQQMIIDAE